MDAIAQGDLTKKMQAKGAGDRLSLAINQVVDNLTDTAEKVDALAQGNYETIVKPLSKNDRLGHSLKTVKKHLKSTGKICHAISKGDLTKKVKAKGESDKLSLAINQVVDNLTDTAEKVDAIAHGNYGSHDKPHSKKDRLSHSLNSVRKRLKETGDICDAIAEGDLTQPININSEDDKLGVSLSLMTTNLRDFSYQSARENWISTGQADLAKLMHSQLEVTELTEQFICYLTQYIGGHLGLFYLADDTGHLSLASQYSFNKKQNLSAEQLIGERLVKEAIKQKKNIMVNDSCQEYGWKRKENNIGLIKCRIVSPICSGKEVKGAIVIGFLTEIDDKAVELLTRSNESIAMAISTVNGRIKLQDLLDKSQRTSEKLQAQQAALQASNEALERQAKSIIESEANLKAQQGILQKFNDELEEKTEYLQRQKQEILDKNIKIKLSKKHIEEKAQELEVSNQYKSEFLANMSHELRTPLNSLLILSELLAQNTEKNLSRNQLESAQIIHQGGHDLLDLINDILDLSKVESGMLALEIDSIEVNQFESSICTQFEPLAYGKEFKLTSELANDLPKFIQTDRMRTLQILKNLMSNAFKFTYQGRVTLRIFVPEKEVVFKQKHLNSQNCIGFSVIDTGVGIKQDKQCLIFEAFQQADGSTSRKFGGTGLGLTISRELCRLLGGELQIESEYNKGSTFTVYLPLLNHGEYGKRSKSVENLGIVSSRAKILTSSSDCRYHEQEYNAQSLAEVQNKSPRTPIALIAQTHSCLKKITQPSLLIIEGDKYFANVLRETAQDKGYKALVAVNAKGALLLAAEHKPSAIILDSELPDLDGLKLLALFKSDLTTRHIPVHIIAAHQAQDRAKYDNAIGVLKNPTTVIDLNKVFSIFKQILDNRTKQVLIIDDDKNSSKSIKHLFANDDLQIKQVFSSKQALKVIDAIAFDCIVLNCSLSIDDAQHIIRNIAKYRKGIIPHFIINSPHLLSDQQYTQMNENFSNVIIKEVKCTERLLDEVLLSLHQEIEFLPTEQRTIIENLYHVNNFFEGHTLLLVDDDLRNTFALSTVLEQKGLNVIIAENGLKALELLQKKPEIEMVLMDIMMPIMDGYEAIKEIRNLAKYQSLPIIALTAKAMAEDRVKCLQAGANFYMNKPVNTTELFILLKVLIAKENIKEGMGRENTNLDTLMNITQYL